MEDRPNQIPEKDTPLLAYIRSRLKVPSECSAQWTRILNLRLAGLPIQTLRSQADSPDAITLLNLLEDAEKEVRRIYLTTAQAKERYGLTRNQIAVDIHRERLTPEDVYLSDRRIYVKADALERLYGAGNPPARGRKPKRLTKPVEMGPDKR